MTRTPHRLGILSFSYLQITICTLAESVIATTAERIRLNLQVTARKLLGIR